MRRIGIAIGMVLALLASARAAETPSGETMRLVEVCKIWGHVRFLHPYVWTRDVDWDAALVAALPKIRAAKDEDEYASAVASMLAALNDPSTRLVPPSASPPPHAPRGAPLVEWAEPTTLLVRLGGALPPDAAKQIEPQLAKAKRVIFDVRAGDEWGGPSEIPMDLYRKVVSRERAVPPLRYLVHNGYRAQSQTFVSSGGYYSAFEELPAELLTPSPGASRRRVAFIVNERSGIPDQALALQASGDGVIIAHGVSFDELTVSNAMPLGSKHRMLIRTYEFVPIGAAVPPHVDVELPATDGEDAVLKAALAQLAKPAAKWKPLPPLPPMRWRAEKMYEEMKSPDVAYRLLSLFRLWNVIDRFYPYKALLDEKWDAVLTAFVPRVIAADGRKAYAEVMAELSTHIEDTHVRLGGANDELGTGWAQPPFLARMIERQPTIVFVAEAGRALGVHEGDVIVSVDDEPIAARLTRTRRFVAASNEPVRDGTTLLKSLGGAPQSAIKLTVRDAHGAMREVKTTRGVVPGRFHWRGGDVVRILDGNVGYVDLDRLERGEVDAMFDQLAGTRAIIFDMRGYPNGTAWSIAPRLNVRGAAGAARFERPLVMGEVRAPGGRFMFTQDVPPNWTGKPLYRGKTFMLVDERTISQAEHTGLFFEAAAGTKFIGSTTAGANGDVTDVTLPGGLNVTFTGHDVRHADGRQLQRVGLPVDIRVTPTLAGIRAGRDEVLERALVEARK